jgi:hypothetical protein
VRSTEGRLRDRSDIGNVRNLYMPSTQIGCIVISTSWTTMDLETW